MEFSKETLQHVFKWEKTRFLFQTVLNYCMVLQLKFVSFSFYNLSKLNGHFLDCIKWFIITNNLHGKVGRRRKSLQEKK